LHKFPALKLFREGDYDSEDRKCMMSTHPYFGELYSAFKFIDRDWDGSINAEDL